MKKTINIIALYLLFGAIIAIFISATGGYVNLVVDPIKLSLTLSQYLLLMLVVMVAWLPVLVGSLFLNANYFTLPFFKAIFSAIIILFVFLSVLMLKKNKKYIEK